MRKRSCIESGSEIHAFFMDVHMYKNIFERITDRITKLLYHQTFITDKQAAFALGKDKDVRHLKGCEDKGEFNQQKHLCTLLIELCKHPNAALLSSYHQDMVGLRHFKNSVKIVLESRFLNLFSSFERHFHIDLSSAHRSILPLLI